MWFNMDPKNVCTVIVNAHECEGSIAEANDCLRSVKGYLEWYDKKQRFCPHLISDEDSVQVQNLIDRVITEESPVMEYNRRFTTDHDLGPKISPDLQLRVKEICDRFGQIKKMLQFLYNKIQSIIKSQNALTFE